MTPDSIPILEAPPGPAWTYAGKVVRVIDGDTLAISVDVGFNTHIEEVVRLRHINAPEVVGETKAEGLAATAALREMLPNGHAVVIHTVKDRNDRWGRLLAEIWTSDGTYVNGAMVAGGHAVPYEGGKR